MHRIAVGAGSFYCVYVVNDDDDDDERMNFNVA